MSFSVSNETLCQISKMLTLQHNEPCEIGILILVIYAGALEEFYSNVLSEETERF